MTITEIVTSIIAKSSNGKYTDESSQDIVPMELEVHKYRAHIIQQQFEKHKTIHPDWLQRYYPEIDQEKQDEDCKLKFECPQIVYFDKKRDGISYIGSSDYNENFRRVWERQTLATMMNHPVTRPRHNRIYCLYEQGTVEMYASANIKDPMVVAVFSNPTDIPTYNKYVDPYPIDPQSLAMVEDMIVSKISFTILKTPGDPNAAGQQEGGKR